MTADLGVDLNDSSVGLGQSLVSFDWQGRMCRATGCM